MSDWRRVPLGSLFTEPKDRKIPEASDRHYVGLEHIDPETIRIVRWAEPTTATSTSKVFRENDVLFGRLRPYLKKVALADFDGVCSGEILVLRANESVSPGFLYLLAANGTTIKHAVDVSAGSRMPRVASRDLSELEVALPPRPVQERIVGVISAVDDQIAALDGEVAAVERVRDRLVDEFTSAADDSVKPLGELCPVIGSGPSWEARDESSVPSEGALTVLKITNTRPDGSIDLSELAYVAGLPARTKTIGSTSLVMIRTNGNRKRIGNVYLPPQEVQGAAVSAFQFTLDALDVETRDYLYLVLRSPRLQHQMSESASGSTGLGNLAVRWLKTLAIPWPDAETREVQVEAVRAIDAKIAATRAEADRLRQVRAGLLSGMLDRTIDIDTAERAA